MHNEKSKKEERGEPSTVINVYIYICIYICIYIYMYTYIYIYAKPYIYVYVYINIHMYAKPRQNLLLHNSMSSVSRYSFPRCLYIYIYIWPDTVVCMGCVGCGNTREILRYVRFYVREYTAHLCGMSVAQFSVVRCCNVLQCVAECLSGYTICLTH